MKMTIRRGDIYYADLSPVVGSEQGGIRPVLIVQNDVGNRYSPTVIVSAITSQREKTKLPTHIQVTADNCGLAKDSIVLLEQVRTIDKQRLKEKMGTLDDRSMYRVDKALSVSFGLEAEPVAPYRPEPIPMPTPSALPYPARTAGYYDTGVSSPAAVVSTGAAGVAAGGAVSGIAETGSPVSGTISGVVPGASTGVTDNGAT